MICRGKSHHSEQPGNKKANENEKRPDGLNEKEWHTANTGSRLVEECYYKANMRTQSTGRVQNDQCEECTDDGYSQNDGFIVCIFGEEEGYFIVHLERFQTIVNVNVRPPKESSDEAKEDGNCEQDDPRGNGCYKVNDKSRSEAADKGHYTHYGHLLVGITNIADDLL